MENDYSYRKVFSIGNLEDSVRILFRIEVFPTGIQKDYEI